MIVDTTQTKIEGELNIRPVNGCPGIFHTNSGMGVLTRQHTIDGVRYIGTDKCCCQDSFVPGSCSVCHGCPFGSTDEDWIKFKQQNPAKYCSQAVWHRFKFYARHNFWMSYSYGTGCNTIECWKCSTINYLSPYQFDDGHDSHDRWCIECSSDLFPDWSGEGSWEKIIALGGSFPRRLVNTNRRRDI